MWKRRRRAGETRRRGTKRRGGAKPQSLCEVEELRHTDLAEVVSPSSAPPPGCSRPRRSVSCGDQGTADVAEVA